MANLESMSKKQLESFARTELNIELDRRHSKKDLLEKVKSKLGQAPSVKEKPVSTSAIESVVEALNYDPYVGVISEARSQVGDDLVKIKEYIKFLNDTSQENYQLILTEIDKYND